MHGGLEVHKQSKLPCRFTHAESFQQVCVCVAHSSMSATHTGTRWTVRTHQHLFMCEIHRHYIHLSAVLLLNLDVYE